MFGCGVSHADAKKKIADEIENYLKRKHILLWM